MDSVFYYTGCFVWGVMTAILIYCLYCVLPPTIRNIPSDLWLLLKSPFISKEKATSLHNTLSASSDIIKSRWCYNPLMYVLKKKAK